MYEEVDLILLILVYITVIIAVIKGFEYLQGDRKG